LRLKCSINFWAFEPEPEAKMAILFFIDNLFFNEDEATIVSSG